MRSFYEFKLGIARFVFKRLVWFLIGAIIGVILIVSSLTFLPTTIGAIVGFSLVVVYILLCVFSSSYSRHYRAIDEALELQEMYPKLKGKLSSLIGDSKREKSPTPLREWLDNFKELSSAMTNLQVLEGEKAEMEKGIPLKEVKDEIEATKERMRELESLLD